MTKKITLFNKFHILQRTFYLFLIVSVTLLTVFIVDYWVSKYIEREINDRITLLNGRAESIKVTLLSRTLKVKSLEWASTTDSSNLRQHSLRVKTLTAKGISLYELFARNTVVFNQVTIDSGKFQFDRSSKSIFPKQGDLAAPTFKFKSILLKSIESQITLDSVVSFYALLNCKLQDVSIAKKVASKIDYGVKSIEGQVTNISISRHQGMYGLTIGNIGFNTETGLITIDSTLVIPNFTKFEFAKQPDGKPGRLNLSIPQVTITGIDFSRLADTTWVASKIEIKSFDLYYFKDKRFTTIPKKNKPLPMVAFLNLPYTIKVDSITVHNSHVVYEEFPKTGIESGTISIDAINAVFTDFNNRIEKGDPTFATLQTNALLMNSGRINATFQFPLDGSPAYHAKGSVSEMSFDQLNPILKSVADVRVESGYLNTLTFNYTYTDLASKGLLEVDYKDLYVTILNKNKESTNQVKTLVANTFVKSKIDQTHTAVRRSAVIDIERDRTKSIFNIWTKSLLDGLKRSMLGGFVKKDKKKRSDEIRKKD
jgi:hypothetical protein